MNAVILASLIQLDSVVVADFDDSGDADCEMLKLLCDFGFQ